MPESEKAAGITVTTARGASQGNGPNTIGSQLRGIAADVLLMSRGLDELLAESRIVVGTDTDLAKRSWLYPRAGAPKPDVSTVDAFKQMLVRAKSITFPSSTTGIYRMTKYGARNR